MIVKVQISQSPGPKTILIYNNDKSILEQFPATEEFLKMMNGEPKKYFHAVLDHRGLMLKAEVVKGQVW